MESSRCRRGERVNAVLEEKVEHATAVGDVVFGAGGGKADGEAAPFGRAGFGPRGRFRAITHSRTCGRMRLNSHTRNRSRSGLTGDVRQLRTPQGVDEAVHDGPNGDIG